MPDGQKPNRSISIARTGWNTALQRRPKIAVQAEVIRDSPPQTLALKFESLQIKTRGFCFSPKTPALMDRSANTSSDLARPFGRKNGSARTRIKPPTDIVKLDDRLFYLLQPPLENLLDGAALQMPFRPFPYQLSGISFLFPRHTAILADEMGLGKTMQAITSMRLLLHAGEVRTILLVCPKPLVSNWQREFQMWAPEIPVAVIAGDQTRREWQWRLPDVPVKIANYELLLRDRELLADGNQHFDLVTLDEAQRIKNRSSSSSQVVSSISRTRSWALTGTPVENSPDDLVGIFEFLTPGYLSPGMTPRRLREATRDHILRRTKDQVLKDMPPKLYRDAALELTPSQSASYQSAEKDGVIRLNKLGKSITIQHVFELVLRLKQICNFAPDTGHSSKLDRLEADLEEVADSGKKAIVFSQWVKTLNRLSDRLKRFGPIEYHGQVPSRKRDGLIEQFRNDPDCHVILMSYGAGSVGLNLQFCEYVFLFDRWWNPAVEDQAINRAHRIGVAGPVTVTRFVTDGTIEERIDQILTQKREVFEAILADSDSPGSLGLSQDDIFGLFDLHVPGGRLESSADAA
ncbi:MAG: DEAD/DEAH box helicase [Pirellulaceae bacterium]|nr:DEAD/DEAH box helicase [Pirellulaceae bacterium]